MALVEFLDSRSQLLGLSIFDIMKESDVTTSLITELPITDYQNLSEGELFERIVVAKKSLGNQVLILGHNYQRDEVIVHADLRGDSLLLSKLAAERSEFASTNARRRSSSSTRASTSASFADWPWSSEIDTLRLGLCTAGTSSSSGRSSSDIVGSAARAADY